MLSGKAPFQRSSRDDSAAAIMHRIKGGDFHLEGSEWQSVSDEAKKLIKGKSVIFAFQKLRTSIFYWNIPF